MTDIIDKIIERTLYIIGAWFVLFTAYEHYARISYSRKKRKLKEKLKELKREEGRKNLQHR